jgi:TonB family protein
MARFLSVAFAASTVLHGVAYASLGLAPKRSSTRLPASSVVFEVRDAPPVETRRAPVEPVPPEDPKPLERRAVAASPPPVPEPEQPRAPVDLSGVTLTNTDGTGSFAMPTGDGSVRTGALGPLGAKAAPSASPSASSAPSVPAPAPSELVASQDLSGRPEPPPLDGRLRTLYPEEARRRSVSGSASLRVRIDRDGRVRSAAVLGESFPGFGAACQKAVLGSSWSPPRDRNGRAVSTEVRYTCRFVVD